MYIIKLTVREMVCYKRIEMLLFNIHISVHHDIIYANDQQDATVSILPPQCKHVNTTG